VLNLTAVVRAVSIVVAAAVAARVCGLILPTQPAMAVALAAVLAVPGWAALCASGLSRRLDAAGLAGAVPAAGLAAWVPALAAGFALRLSFDVVLVLIAVQTVVLLAVADPRPHGLRPADAWSMAIGALVAAIAASRWQESLAGDEVFHLQRARKILAVPHLSLDAVSELAGGHPHAGYVFPLLHAVEAAALRASGISPVTGFPNLVPAAAVLMALTVFAVGRAVGGTPVGAATVAVAIWGAMISNHPILGMASWPGPFTFLVLIPAMLLALTELLRTPGDRRLQGLLIASAVVVALVHVSYCVPALALVVGTVAYARRDVLAAGAAVAACGMVVAFVWYEALRGYPKPVAKAGPWQHPNAHAYVTIQHHAVSLNAETITGHQVGFLLAVLALLPLLVWRVPQFAFPAALTSGGLALVALPGSAQLMDATVGVGQFHRFGAAIPWQITVGMLAAIAVAYAGRRTVAVLIVFIVLAALVGHPRVHSFWGVWPAIPTTPVAILAVGGAVVYAYLGLRALPAPPPAVAVLPTLAVALAAVALSDPSSVRGAANDLWHGYPVPAQSTVPAPLVNFIHSYGGIPVVLADQLRSYRLGAYADVYAVAVPEVRTRAEPASRPDQRRSQVSAFLSPSTPQSVRDAILRDYGVNIVVVPQKRGGLLRELAKDPLLQRRMTIPSGGGGLVVYTVER
jgi:hypothetical protein